MSESGDEVGAGTSESDAAELKRLRERVADVDELLVEVGRVLCELYDEEAGVRRRASAPGDDLATLHERWLAACLWNDSSEFREMVARVAKKANDRA